MRDMGLKESFELIFPVNYPFKCQEPGFGRPGPCQGGGEEEFSLSCYNDSTLPQSLLDAYSPPLPRNAYDYPTKSGKKGYS